MNYVFGTEFQELAQEAGDSPAYHGQATHSPWPILNARIMRFRNQSKFWDPTWWIPTLARFQRRIGGRAALVTDVCVRKARVTAYNLHLESRGGDNLRDSQLREVLQDAAQAERESPVVLGGDFNFELAGTDQAVTFCDAGFRNPFEGRSQPTIVNSRGTRRAIDSILMSRGIRPVSVRVHSDVAASDHYPLSLTVVIES